MLTMLIWQVDFYRRPLKDPQGQILWELLICTPDRFFEFTAYCPQSQVNADWLKAQLQQAAGTPEQWPLRLQVFRPQCLTLLETAAQAWGIPVEATRQTIALKQWLQERSQQYSTLEGYTGEPYQPIALDRPPPLPLPENLWGDRWQFATLPAQELVTAFAELPIPIYHAPPDLQPLSLNLASDLPIPGVVITGGRQSMRLARWLADVQPVAINYVPGAPDGLILEVGLVDRWVVATFADAEVAIVAQTYEQRKQASRGLHFLLVQPDDSGRTYSGFWLLRLAD